MILRRAYLCAVWLLAGLAATVRAQTITNQPQSVTVNNGSTAVFSVGTTNATNFQWYLNGSALTNSPTITGATNPVLTLDDVNSNEAGSYTVVVDGPTTSSNAILTTLQGTIVTLSFSGLLPSAPGSNLQVQLFDHDKPATVQNFLHYIEAGGFSNMFFERLVTNFILQGGDYSAADRTNTNAPMDGLFIPIQVTEAAQQPTPPYPASIIDEAGFGPFVRNEMGTIAMALGSSTNSAACAFFFNLTNNPVLDATADGGPFCVFGRVVDQTSATNGGTNFLNYFNTLSEGEGWETNGVFYDDFYATAIYSVTNLPVNYLGTNPPANANLVFCDFSFSTPLDTNPPTVSILSPAPGALFTNSSLTATGTASDDVGVGDTICLLIPQPSGDGTYPNASSDITNYAFGSNWSVNLHVPNPNGSSSPVPPGVYQFSVEAQDGAGNLSPASNQLLTVTAVTTNGGGSVIVNGDDAVGYPFQIPFVYDVNETPGTNQIFVDWTSGSQTLFTNRLQFTMSSGVLWTANFISNGLPNSLAITYPPANDNVPAGPVTITGTIDIDSVPAPPATVVCQIYTQGGTAVGPPVTNSGITTSNWSVTTTNLQARSYVVEALASDSASNQTVLAENFNTATNYAPLQLIVVGPGTIAVVGPGPISGYTNGEPALVGSYFTVTASPDSGQFFYIWSNSSDVVSIAPTQTYTNSTNLSVTATFVSNTLPSNCITFTLPPTNVILSNGYVNLGGTISNVPVGPLSVTCQIFSETSLLAVTRAATTTNAITNWGFTMGTISAGTYIALVKAVDQAGNSTLISNVFNAVVDLTRPTISILSPTSPAFLTGNIPLTVTGIASDAQGLAAFQVTLDGQAASDGTEPEAHGILNEAAMTNWTVNVGVLPPGAYAFSIFAIDNIGNVNGAFLTLTNTAVLIQGEGTVSLSESNVVKPNPVGYPLQTGKVYKLAATPMPGQMFVGWSEGAFATTKSTVVFTNAAGLLWTATFAPTNAKAVSITYPPANARLQTNSFLLKGRVGSSFQSGSVSCRISSLTTGTNLLTLAATISGAGWSASVSNLPPDNYLVQATATNGSGRSATVSERFFVLAFGELAGTYTGLFLNSDKAVAPTNSGFVTFTLSPSGVMSGKIEFPAYPPVPIYPILVQNDFFTSGQMTFTLKNFHGGPLEGEVNFNLDGTSNVATGGIVSSNWASPLTCYQAVKKLSSGTVPATGRYVFTLQPAGETNGPGTNGYAVLTVTANGGMALSGALPDNTTFSEAGKVSTNGVWPICVNPTGDKTNGMLIGWATNVPGGGSGQLYWYKSPGVGSYFTEGIGLASNFVLNATGTNHAPPVAGSVYAAVFQGGTIAPPLTNTLMVTSAGQFGVQNDPEDKLKISLTASGALTGSLVNPATGVTLKFKGAFISPAQGGFGFIPDTGGQIGVFQLQLAP